MDLQVGQTYEIDVSLHVDVGLPAYELRVSNVLYNKCDLAVHAV